MSTPSQQIEEAEMRGVEDLFGPVIHAYTRRQAVEDGEQIEVTETGNEAGIGNGFRLFLTRAVWSAYVEVPAKVRMQDERGRLWDIVWMLSRAIRAGRGGAELTFGVHVRNSNRAGTPPLVQLKAQCGPTDIDDPRPAITVMLPEED